MLHESRHCITTRLETKHQMWPYTVLNRNNPVGQDFANDYRQPTAKYCIATVQFVESAGSPHRMQMLLAVLPSHALETELSLNF